MRLGHIIRAVAGDESGRDNEFDLPEGTWPDGVPFVDPKQVRPLGTDRFKDSRIRLLAIVRIGHSRSNFIPEDYSRRLRVDGDDAMPQRNHRLQTLTARSRRPNRSDINNLERFG